MTHHAPVTGKRPQGMAAFSIVWAGQLVSWVGTGMTRFGLSRWVWERTG